MFTPNATCILDYAGVFTTYLPSVLKNALRSSFLEKFPRVNDKPLRRYKGRFKSLKYPIYVT
jgi:hypothetical protein